MMYIGMYWPEKHIVFIRNKDIVDAWPITGTRDKNIKKSIQSAVEGNIRKKEPFFILYGHGKEMTRFLNEFPGWKDKMAGIMFQDNPSQRFMGNLWRLTETVVKDSFEARIKAGSLHFSKEILEDYVRNKCPMTAAIAGWPHHVLLGGRG